MRVAGIGKAELGRRLGWHGPQIDRLLDLNHPSKIEQIDCERSARSSSSASRIMRDL